MFQPFKTFQPFKAWKAQIWIFSRLENIYPATC